MAYLEASLCSLIVRSRTMQDPTMLKRMPARDLAVFFGTLFDRTMRMLELAPALLGDRQETGRPGSGKRGA